MDVIASLDEFIRDVHPPRGDEHLRHVSDLAGCDRETWARFKGMLRPHDADTLRKFALGFDVENAILTAIGRTHPDLILGARVALSIGLDGIEGAIVDDAYQPRPDELVGHPDGILDGTILEIKSTEFMTERTPPYHRIVPLSADDMQHHYAIQAGAYALALGKQRVIVIIQCRASGIVSAISFDPRKYEDEIMERIRDVTAISLDEKPQPKLHLSTINAKTGQSWLCKYCRIPKAACELNRYEPLVIEGREVIEI